VLLALLLPTACSPFSRRPAVHPLPLAPSAEVKGKPPAVSERILDAARAAGLPLALAAPTDGYAETPWLDTAGFQATSRRPLGADVVRYRMWVDAARPNYSRVTIEPSYRLAADPSLPERELDRLVPAGHPAYVRAESLLVRMGGRAVRRPAAAPVPGATPPPDSLRKTPATPPR
jgi:hypothetical protein